MGCAILPHLRNLVEIIEHGKRGCREDFKIESSKEQMTQCIALCSTKFLGRLISFTIISGRLPTGNLLIFPQTVVSAGYRKVQVMQ